LSGVVNFDRSRSGLPGVQLRKSQRYGGHSPAGFFDRAELNAMLALYSRMVMAGVWRDYSIETTNFGAEFGVYRSSFERPVYRLVKLGKRAREGGFAVIEQGRVVKRAAVLIDLLHWLEQAQAKAPRLFVVGA